MANLQPAMIIIRPAQFPGDTQALSVLNTSFETDRIYRLVQKDLSFQLLEGAVGPPLRKQYPFDPSDPEERQHWDYSIIAEMNSQIVGFAVAQYTAWNRRVVIWHLYVAPHIRNQGVGTQLLDSLESFAQSMQARCLWLETQNINYPAIQFYLRNGFQCCGFDTYLYDPASVLSEEAALFFVRPLD